MRRRSSTSLRKKIGVALQADQQSLVELVDALDDRLDCGVVGRELPFQDAREERGRVERAELAAARGTLAKVVEKGHLARARGDDPGLADEADDGDWFAIVRVSQGGNLDVEGAAMIVGTRPTCGPQQVGLRVARDAQLIEQCDDILVRRAHEVDPQQVLIAEGARVDLSGLEIAILAVRIEQRDLHARPGHDAHAALCEGGFAVAVALPGCAGSSHCRVRPPTGRWPETSRP